MATIRWCPIYPKWDIYQSLWLLGDYIVTIIIWGPVYHHLAFLTGIVELNWLLGLRFQLVLPKNRHCLAHVFLALWLGWKSHEWFPGTINFTNLLFFLDTLTNQAVCTFVKPIWTCRLSGLATNMHNLYRGKSKNKPHLWVRKNTQQNWVWYNSIIYIYIYIYFYIWCIYGFFSALKWPCQWLFQLEICRKAWLGKALGAKVSSILEFSCWWKYETNPKNRIHISVKYIHTYQLNHKMDR